MPVLTKSVPLPSLYHETCGFWGRVTRSCRLDIRVLNTGAYSHELNAVVLYGRAVFGDFISLFLGLASGDQEITKSGTSFFMGDIPNTGRVVLSGTKGFALYDGQKLFPVQETRSKGHLPLFNKVR